MFLWMNLDAHTPRRAQHLTGLIESSRLQRIHHDILKQSGYGGKFTRKAASLAAYVSALPLGNSAANGETMVTATPQAPALAATSGAVALMKSFCRAAEFSRT